MDMNPLYLFAAGVYIGSLASAYWVGREISDYSNYEDFGVLSSEAAHALSSGTFVAAIVLLIIFTLLILDLLINLLLQWQFGVPNWIAIAVSLPSVFGFVLLYIHLTAETGN